MQKMKDYRYCLGLDLGIGSIGWAIIEINKDDYPKRLLDLGVRVFEIAEVPKTGESLNKSRREARLSRRRLKRKKDRLRKIKRWLIEKGYISKIKDLDLAINIDVWDLRLKGLERKLTNLEFARVILHLGKYRGFLSNRKSELKEKEMGPNNKTMQNVNKKVESLEIKTFASFLKNSPKKRNNNGIIESLATRDLIISELNQILDAQINFGDNRINKEDKDFLTTIIYKNEDPSIDNISKMIGNCTFFDGKNMKDKEPRIAKDSYTFEYFSFLQKLNNIKSSSSISGEVFDGSTLDKELRRKLFELALSKEKVYFSDVRKVFKFDETVKFNHLPEVNSTGKTRKLWREYYKQIKGDPTKEESLRNEVNKKINELKKNLEKDTVFFTFKGYHKLNKALKEFEEWNNLKKDPNFIDEVFYCVTRYKTDGRIKGYFKNSAYNYLPDRILESLPNSDKFGHLSKKALDLIIPYLESGEGYDKAVEKAGLINKNRVGNYEYMPIINPEEIRNPVVLRAVSQNRKLIKAIVRKYSYPTFIHLELSREMAKSRKDRQIMERMIDENRMNSIEIDNILINEFGLSRPSKKDRAVYKLWIEQNHTCIYSLEPISASDLFKDKNVEIDHIIPLSLSMDDSIHNTVLVKTYENQKKGRRTPLEYFETDERRHKFLTFIKTLNLSRQKVERLMLEKLEDFDKKDFSSRAINDTRYISKYMRNYLEKHMKFADPSVKNPVRNFNGSYTSLIRYNILGIPKDRSASNRHHALDATIVACATNSLQLKVSDYFKDKENYDKSRIKPVPWENFREDVIARTYDTNILKFYENNPNLKLLYSDILDHIKPLFVSRMPNRKVSGQAHDATITSAREFNKGKIIKRVPITSIKLEKLNVIVNQDKYLIEQLKIALQKNGDKPDKAFADGFIYNKSNGESIKIYRIKIYEDSRSGLNVRHGIAGNGSMVRIDIFKDEKKYYVVPIYSYQIAKKFLPDKAIVSCKPESQWTDISDKDFLFSVYPGEYLKVIDGKGNELEGYYIKSNRSNATITINSHDAPKQNREDKERYKEVAYSSAREIVKYDVDFLGEKVPIRNSKRML